MSEITTITGCQSPTQPARPLNGRIRVPGDKSISHRALLFGALAEGTTHAQGLLPGQDVMSTARCLRQLGVDLQFETPTEARIVGCQGRGFLQPTGPLDCGNSGTTIRLLMGILAGQKGRTSANAFKNAELFGDESLSRRPMKRIADPLIKMGAKIDLREGRFPPVHLQASDLQAIDYDLPVASAQLKSALLLAGLYAKGTTRIGGLIDSRDHTERWLPAFGVSLNTSATEIRIQGGQKLRAASILVPGDPSSAAFWIAAASLIPKSELEISNVCLNPTRIGFIRVLKRMGADIKIREEAALPESVGSLTIKGAELTGTAITPAEIPSLIDELPLFAVVAALAHGISEVRGAEELRVKESDRISVLAKNLRAMGGEIEERPDGFRLAGKQRLHAAVIKPHGDHRIAMAFSIAALLAEGVTQIEDPGCVAVSYPGFYETLVNLRS